MKNWFQLLLTLLIVSFHSDAQITFQKTLGGSTNDYGYSVSQTTDGGYIVAGSTIKLGIGGSEVCLFKTDNHGDIQWTKTIGGPAFDGAYSIIQTNDLGYVLTGYASGLGAGDDDVYLIKTDMNGDSLWTRVYGGTGAESGRSVQQTNDGGFIITGYTTSFGAGNNDVYLIKMDMNGDTLWSRTYGNSEEDFGYSVQQTSDNGYIITGSTISPGLDSSDVLLIKTDANGDSIWTRTFGESGNDEGEFVEQTPDGGYVIAGTTNSFGAGNFDVYLIKTDTNGNILWTKTYGGSQMDLCRYAQYTSDGGYIIAGFTRSFGAIPDKAYLIKTDMNGDTLWTRMIGGSGNDGDASSVKQTTDGGYILTGNSISSGNFDFYLIKTDDHGQSGCNESGTSTFVTIPASQESVPSLIVIIPVTLEFSTASSIGSGGTANTFCLDLGTHELSNMNAIEIWPNPSSGQFVVSFEDIILKGRIQIYNMIGETVFDEQLNGDSEKQIDLKKCSDGIYFVSVYTGESSYFRKIVKN